MKKQLTLSYVCDQDRVLLGFKKRGFGAGLWNGFGGKLEEGETIEEAAIRELEEESGLTAKQMKEIGLLEFTFETDLENQFEVHVFKITDFSGNIEETEEMKPEWFLFEKIPFENMWAADREWLPLLLKDKSFHGCYHFDKPSNEESAAKVISRSLELI